MVKAATAEVKAPDGTPLIKQVICKEELHTGPLAHLFPDMVLELHRPGGYTPACLPSRGSSGPVVERLGGKALLGRKGRSLPGCHTEHGVLIVAGDGVEEGEIEGASLVDVAPVVTALVGAPAASWFTGSPPSPLPKPLGVSSERHGDRRNGAPESQKKTSDEERVIAEVTTRDDIVLATGGGAVIREANRRALAERGTVVYLQVSLDEQIARTRRDRNRPLLQGGDPAATLRRLMAERDPLYREVADHVVATSGQSARTVAQNLADLLREG